MAKQLTFVALLVLQGVLLSVAAPKSSGSTAFDEWLATFDPSTALESKMINCVDKKDGFYADEPDTCSDSYYACVSGSSFPQKCSSGEVFDNSTNVKACVMDRYVASSPACANYPAPNCKEDPLTMYLPTKMCSDLHYICLTSEGAPQFQSCSPGLPTHFFDPITKTCQPTDGVPACVAPAVPPTVPSYGCSGKTPDLAYATGTCSPSFYTCASAKATPKPGSCGALEGAGAGTVFDYTAAPAAPSSSLCVPKTKCSKSSVWAIL